MFYNYVLQLCFTTNSLYNSPDDLAPRIMSMAPKHKRGSTVRDTRKPYFCQR